MNIQDYIAEQTERMAANYAHFIETTHQDRLDWHPKLEGAAHVRSILGQVEECIEVNRVITKMLRGEPINDRGEIALAGSEDARQLLSESAADLAGAIRQVTDADLDREFEHPRGMILGKNLIMMPMRNMSYHIGQLNLIQIMYGDAEFHVPPRWR